jgi:small subunit ribosomal protein S11
MSEEENKEEEKKDLPPENEPEVVSEDNASASTESIEPDDSKPEKKAKESKSEPKQKPSSKTEKDSKPDESDSQEKSPTDDESGAEPKAEKKAKDSKPEPKQKPSSKTKKVTKPDASDSQEKSSTDDESGAEPKAEKKEETAEDLLGANIEQVKIRKAKGSKNISSGICFIVATFNNTKVSFSDMKGNVISWSSSGKCNFRGSRKSTAYAAQVVTQDAGRAAMSHGMKEVVVKVKGPGMGRDSAIRALQSLGFIVSTIIDVTPVPHNGCRPPKRRRV